MVDSKLVLEILVEQVEPVTIKQFVGVVFDRTNELQDSRVIGGLLNDLAAMGLAESEPGEKKTGYYRAAGLWSATDRGRAYSLTVNSGAEA